MTPSRPRPVRAALALVALLPLTSRAGAQVTLIPHGTQAAVVEAVKADLAAQGFTLEHNGKREALFNLDRGNQVQHNGSVVHVHIEVKLSFRIKKEGLEVTGAQEAVGEATQGMDFRKPMDSPSEVATFQRMLDSVRDSIEAHAPKDSTAARDSTH